MYRHLLVPTDGSFLSTELVNHAVDFARDAGARITFFHAIPDYFATADGALMRVVSPENAASAASANVHAILLKAGAAAEAASVPYGVCSRVSDRPYEAILEIAEEKGCDLIFTASHGPKSVGGLLLGSETLKVLMHASISVLVSTVARNAMNPAMNKAIAVIQDEHRSLAAVLHGLKRHVAEVRDTGGTPDFGLLQSGLHYIEEFPEKLHHPKEEDYLFSRLRRRTKALDDVFVELQAEHIAGPQSLARLNDAFLCFMAERDAACFLAEIDTYAAFQFRHFRTEERIVIPAARIYLTKEDWHHIAMAFSENEDPRFAYENSQPFRDAFSGIARRSFPELGNDQIGVDQKW